MDRRDFYFRQKVTEAELDGAFDAVEAADWGLAIDHGLTGIALAMDPAQNGVPNLTINVSGPGVAYDPLGRRIAIPSTQNVDVSVDENAVSTAVAGGANEKWVSVFIEFDRDLSDPRIDGNSLGLFFVQEEAFRFVVRQGAEAPVGLATRPPLDPNMVLVCDILRTFGVGTILNGAIDLDRRQDAFRLEAGTLDIIAGTPKEAIGLLLDHLNNHVDGAASRHPASAIDYAGGAAWADGTTNPATTVELQLDKIISDLGTIGGSGGAARIGLGALGNWFDGTTQPATTLFGRLNTIITQLVGSGAGSGAQKLGCNARTNWLGGRTNPSGVSIFAAIDKIITDLAVTSAGDDGAERIGAQANGNLAAGSVRSQLDELDAEKGGLALANTWTNTNLYNALVTMAAGLTVGAGVVDIQERITLGSDLLGTANNADQPRIQTTLPVQATVGTDGRVLLWESVNADVNRRPARLYATQANGGGFEIAINAVWDNDTSTWSKTVAGSAAMLFEMSAAGFAMRQRNSAAAGTWAQSGWNQNQFTLGPNVSSPSMTIDEGQFQFTPAAASGGTTSTNPGGTTATLANTLYAINTIDAWIKGIGNTGKDDGFGTVGSPVAAGSGATVTWDRSASGTFNQAVVATGNTATAGSATTAGFMTAVQTVNTSVIRRWRWDGAAVSETTLGDWSAIRMARMAS